VNTPKELMKRIVERTVEPWEGYLQICAIFSRNAHLQLPELRDLVRIEGIDPNGSVSVTSEPFETVPKMSAIDISFYRMCIMFSARGRWDYPIIR
jgi:hypothetical protein